MSQGNRMRRWLILLAAVLAVGFTAPATDGTPAGTTVALGAIKGPGNPPDPGPVG
jgi:hypothetical protein